LISSDRDDYITPRSIVQKKSKSKRFRKRDHIIEKIGDKALTKTALERKESRGRFYRLDFPVQSQGKPEAHILTLSEAGEVTLRKEVLDPQWNPDFKNMLDKERWG
jgi:hypothetical protein